MQGGGNRQRGQRLGQLIALLPLLEQPGLEHHLGQLLDKQRHAIGLGHDLRHNLRRQGLAVRHLGDHRCCLAPWQARQRHLGEVGSPRPRWAESQAERSTAPG